MLTFLTLGPAGGNHEFVLRRYLNAHRLSDRVEVRLIDDFHAGASSVIRGEADFMLQCAVHRDAPDITGTYRMEMVVVDAFISPSRHMALVRRRSTSSGSARVGFQPATRRYADLSAWSEFVEEPTVMSVHEGLLAGRYDAGIAFDSLARAHVHQFEVVQDIGSICDAWIVYGRDAVDDGQAVVWTDSPVARRCYKP
jgi:hypothetical protein